LCGRARLSSDYSEIKARLKLASPFAAPNLRPSWNIAPTDEMLCIVRDPQSGARKPVKMRWGLIPAWAKDAKLRFTTINARAETIAETPAFRDAWRAGRRCLVITDGFYEWRKGDRQPFAVGMTDGGLMVMAGLWETWISPDGEVIVSCTVITTEANGAITPLHDRMPVILAEQDWPLWLGEIPAPDAALHALLRPCPDDALRVWPVSKRVGNVRNNDATLSLIEEPLLLL
jgi:putative SOS response-associated peptidase YedK